MKVHQAIARALWDNGVDTMFGLIGDANLFIAQSYQDLGGTYLAASHEAIATSMADGYARVSGKLGVATVTHGPGLMNTINATREAVKNGTPMLLLCGDTPTEERQHIQDVDQRALVLPTGAGFEQVRSPRTAVADVAVALRRARVERRPIALNVPIDFQWEDVEYAPAIVPPPVATAISPDPDALDRAVGLIASARRPLVLAGRGALTADAVAALLRLADRLGAPVATTLPAKDLFGDVPFDLGICGTFATPAATETILQADCLIAFGAGLNKYTASDGALLEGKRVVQCDIDPTRIGQWSPVDVGVVGDATVVADTIVTWLDEADFQPGTFRAEAEARLAAHAGAPAYQDRSTTETVDIRTFIDRIDLALPEERTLVFDAGRFIVAASRMLHVDPRYRVFGGLSSGTIGLGVGVAVGAAVADRRRTVAAIVGDGGFMLGGLGAFSDAVRHGADLVTLLFNDNSYGAEYVQFTARDMDPGISMHPWPDFAPVAEALGGTGITVRNVGDIELAEKAIANRDRPVLIDIKLDAALIPGKQDPDA